MGELIYQIFSWIAFAVGVSGLGFVIAGMRYAISVRDEIAGGIAVVFLVFPISVLAPGELTEDLNHRRKKAVLCYLVAILCLLFALGLWYSGEEIAGDYGYSSPY